MNTDRALSVALHHVFAVLFEESDLLNIHNRDEIGIEVASQFSDVFKLAAVVIKPPRDLVRRHDFDALLLQASQQAVSQVVLKRWS